jgi:hypothetical protein
MDEAGRNSHRCTQALQWERVDVDAAKMAAAA